MITSARRVDASKKTVSEGRGREAFDFCLAATVRFVIPEA